VVASRAWPRARGPPEVAPPDPTATQVAQNAFLARCARAIRRDLRDSLPRSEVADAFWEWGHPLLYGLAGLIEPECWRRVFVKPTQAGEGAANIEQTRLVWISAWNETLRPWFDGVGRLDLDALLSLTTALKSHGFGGRIMDEVAPEGAMEIAARRVFNPKPHSRRKRRG